MPTPQPDPCPTNGHHPHPGHKPLVVDLGATDTGGPAGVVWSLPHGGDLDANLVHLDPGGAISPHVNADLDVIVSVVSGRGELIVDGIPHPLQSDVLALVPRGARRAIRAGGHSLTYLSIHRRRGPLGIGVSPGLGIGRTTDPGGRHG